jgi:hypothetical protein
MSIIEAHVEGLFRGLGSKRGDLCRNPITGGGFVWREDPIKPQKKAARRALLAREWFAIYGPADAQPLPLWNDERRPGLLDYIVRLYARSLAFRDYDINEHPSFADYASGVLWEDENVEGGGSLPLYPAELPQLKKRFPPRELAGMESGFCWCPPKRKKQTKKNGRLNQERYDKLKRKLERAVSVNAQATSLTPTDESIRIPESVRRAAARANSLYPLREAHSQTEN